MKRRLQLMPEVLPAPNKTATSAVRERTMARLRVLAAVGTSIAAACGGSTASSGSGSSSGGGGGSSGGGGPDGGLPDANKPDSDPGYGVVDPLPPPACFDYATPPTATAKFVTRDEIHVDAGPPPGGDDGRFVRLIVTLNQKDVAVGEVVLDGANGISRVGTDIKAGEVTIDLYQNASSTNFQTTIQIQTSCAKGPTRVYVSISPDGTDKLNVNVSFSGG